MAVAARDDWPLGAILRVRGVIFNQPSCIPIRADRQPAATPSVGLRFANKSPTLYFTARLRVVLK